jgi:uncharacterized membrane protein
VSSPTTSPAASAAAATPNPDQPLPRPSKIVLAFWLLLMLVLWSGNYVAGKIALRTMDPITLVCLRLQLAAFLMLAIYFTRPERQPLKLSDAWPFLYLGFFGVVINQGLFTVGLNYTTSDHSAVLIAIGPIIILLLARALKLEALTVAKVVGMVISFVGVYLLETEQGSPTNSPLLMGDIITFGGVIAFAAPAHRQAGNSPRLARRRPERLARHDLHGGRQFRRCIHDFLLGAAAHDGLARRRRQLFPTGHRHPAVHGVPG